MENRKGNFKYHAVALSCNCVANSHEREEGEGNRRIGKEGQDKLTSSFYQI